MQLFHIYIPLNPSGRTRLIFEIIVDKKSIEKICLAFVKKETTQKRIK